MALSIFVRFDNIYGVIIHCNAIKNDFVLKTEIREP